MSKNKGKSNRIIIAAFTAFIVLLIVYVCVQVSIGRQKLSGFKVSDFVCYYEDACFDVGQVEYSDEMKAATKWLYDISKDIPLRLGKRQNRQDTIFKADFVYKGPATRIYNDGSLCITPAPSEFRGERYSSTWWYFKITGGDIAFYTETNHQIADSVEGWPQEWQAK